MAAFVAAFGDRYTPALMAGNLRCDQVDALAALLWAFGRPDAAERWSAAHAQHDGPEDVHHRAGEEDPMARACEGCGASRGRSATRSWSATTPVARTGPRTAAGDRPSGRRGQPAAARHHPSPAPGPRPPAPRREDSHDRPAAPGHGPSPRRAASLPAGGACGSASGAGPCASRSASGASASVSPPAARPCRAAVAGCCGPGRLLLIRSC